MIEWISELYHKVLREPGFSPALLIVGVIMYGAWTTAYLCIIVSCFRQRSYGVLMVCLCFNVIWEFCFTFQVLQQHLFFFFLVGNGLWFLFDVIIAYQFFRYGREAQVIPFIKDNFHSVAIFTMIICGAG